MNPTPEQLRRWLAIEPGQATPDDHSLLLELAREVMIEKYTAEQGKAKVSGLLDRLREENQSPLEAYFVLTAAGDFLSADLLRRHAKRELAKQIPPTDGPAGMGHYFDEGRDGSLYTPSTTSHGDKGGAVSAERLAATLGIPAESIHMLLHSRRTEITELEAGFVIDFHRKLTAEAEAARIRINARSELGRMIDAPGNAPAPQPDSTQPTSWSLKDSNATTAKPLLRRPLSGRPLQIVAFFGIAVIVVPTFLLWFIGIVGNIERGNYATAILWIAPLTATPWIWKRAARSVSGPAITTEAAAGTSSSAGNTSNQPVTSDNDGEYYRLAHRITSQGSDTSG